jgi:hypothetical protein
MVDKTDARGPKPAVNGSSHDGFRVRLDHHNHSIRAPLQQASKQEIDIYWQPGTGKL